MLLTQVLSGQGQDSCVPALNEPDGRFDTCGPDKISYSPQIRHPKTVVEIVEVMRPDDYSWAL